MCTGIFAQGFSPAIHMISFLNDVSILFFTAHSRAKNAVLDNIHPKTAM